MSRDRKSIKRSIGDKLREYDFMLIVWVQNSTYEVKMQMVTSVNNRRYNILQAFSYRKLELKSLEDSIVFLLAPNNIHDVALSDYTEDQDANKGRFEIITALHQDFLDKEKLSNRLHAVKSTKGDK